MNILKVLIKNIESSNEIKIIKSGINDQTITFFLIENYKDEFLFKKDEEIKIVFKENQVIISKNKLNDFSIENILPVKISHIEKGLLFVRLYLKYEQYKLTAVLTKESFTKMILKEEDNIWIYIKCDEILLLRENYEHI